MKIALIGYGKMGQTIEGIAMERGHEIVARCADAHWTKDQLKEADVAIEFSVPEAAADNIRICFEAGIPVVVGTTGWYDEYDALSQQARDENKGLFTATNFSIGVNIFFQINKELARIMNAFEDYQVNMSETHHIHKLDHPSGTAVTLAEQIVEQLDRKKSYVGQLEGSESPVTPFDLQIVSRRFEEVPGYHEITYHNEIDEIRISHNAKNRMGFAKGAILAAEFMHGKTGVYGMNDLMKLSK